MNKGGKGMRRFTKGRLLIVPLLLAPVAAMGSLALSQAVYAGPPKIVCTTLSGNYDTGGTLTISGCSNGPSGATSATTPFNECQKSCVITETWSDAGSTTSTESYNAPDKLGKTVTKKCKSASAIAVASEKEKVTSGYGAGGKIKATVCAYSDGTIALAPGSKLSL
jgi:hypothetical protein